MLLLYPGELYRLLWKRDKYYNILNKIKTGEKENKVDYYYIQR
jgi:hypothetical protein